MLVIRLQKGTGFPSCLPFLALSLAHPDGSQLVYGKASMASNGEKPLVNSQ